MIRRMVWLNVLGFQGVWWVMALGLPAGHLAWAMSLGLAYVSWHAWVNRSHWYLEAKVVMACVVLGWLSDSALGHWGQTSFSHANEAPWSAWQPMWLMVLWACLGCTVRTSLTWMTGRPRMGALLSAAAGLLSYEAARVMGLMQWSGWQTPVLLLACWGGVFPLLVRWGNSLPDAAPETVLP